MQLEVFGDLAVAVRVGAIGGNDRIVAIAVFARKECSVRRPAKQAYACRTVPMQNGAGALLICLWGSTLSGYAATAVVMSPATISK